MDADELGELFARFGPIEVRRMFGGQGLYADGVMFGLVGLDQLWLKADETTRSSFEKAGCRPFEYERGERRIAMSYWSVPDDAMDEPEALARWARLALEAARRSKKPSRSRGHPGQAAPAAQIRDRPQDRALFSVDDPGSPLRSVRDDRKPRSLRNAR